MKNIPFKKLNQICAVVNPIRLKILLALFLSDIKKNKENGRIKR